ncbi:hypothetical protein M2310_004188 [Rhizobium leguminosarum]|uniref:DNA ligase (ATP) n=1 Tax=Rhizobium esperanzae TaxID=1967781 RepID=A0A7W6XVP8_9HYPH|nr:hypothetical protein [Rhizobium esperanzae]MDH6203507.1 hypothetical protein [Rhizobium leguminosarum]
MTFDLLYFDGHDLRGSELSMRRHLLEDLVPAEGQGDIRLSGEIDADGDQLLASACQHGLEGIIAKRRDSPYRSGRLGDWVKIKCIQSDSFVIVGYERSTVARAGIGRLLLAARKGKELVYVGGVGTGFNERNAYELREMLDALITSMPAASVDRKRAIFVKPKLIAEIEYRAWTDDGKLRHASYKGLREVQDNAMRLCNGCPLQCAIDTRLKNSRQSQHDAEQNERRRQHPKRPIDQELLSRRRPVLIMIWELRSMELRAEIFAEIEAVSEVKDERPDVPIPAVSTHASDKAEREPQLNSIFTQSSFPIGIAIFIQFVHRQIGVLLHPLPDDKPDHVVARLAELARQVAQGVFDIILHREPACITQPQRGPTKHDLKIRSRNICDPIGGVLEQCGGVGGCHGFTCARSLGMAQRN